MLFSTGTLRHVAVGFFGLFYLTSWVYAADTKYCSTFNTADTNRSESIVGLKKIETNQWTRL